MGDATDHYVDDGAVTIYRRLRRRSMPRRALRFCVIDSSILRRQEFPRGGFAGQFPPLMPLSESLPAPPSRFCRTISPAPPERVEAYPPRCGYECDNIASRKSLDYGFTMHDEAEHTRLPDRSRRVTMPPQPTHRAGRAVSPRRASSFYLA